MKKHKPGLGDQGSGLVDHFLFPVFILAILLASCASSPVPSFSGAEEGGEISMLPSGARVYLWADTVRGRPLLDVLSFDGRSASDASQILDKTKSAAVAIFPDQEARRFFIAAPGKFPNFRANLSFTFSGAWKKQKSSGGGNYWYSANDGLALALGSDLVLVSNVDPLESFSKEKSPEGFDDFRRSFVMAGWMNNPSESINEFLASMGIPLEIPAEEFLFGAARTQAGKEPWELVFKLKTQSATHARSLVSLFSVARLFVLRGSAAGGLPPAMEAAALLFANVPEQENEFLLIRTDPVNENKIALLFNMFSIY